MAARMGLSLHEFWDMSPQEFFAYSKGYNLRMDDLQHLAAWQAAAIINHMPRMGSGRRQPVTVDDLMGRRRPVSEDD